MLKKSVFYGQGGRFRRGGEKFPRVQMIDHRFITMTRFHLSLKRLFLLTYVKVIFLHRTVFQRDFQFIENEK